MKIYRPLWQYAIHLNEQYLKKTKALLQKLHGVPRAFPPLFNALKAVNKA